MRNTPTFRNLFALSSSDRRLRGNSLLRRRLDVLSENVLEDRGLDIIHRHMDFGEIQLLRWNFLFE